MSVTPIGFTQTVNYVENTPSVPLPGLGVTDDPQHAHPQRSLSNRAAGKLDGFGGSYNANTGVWTITGNTYTVNLALQNAWFYPTANNTQNATVTTSVVDDNDNSDSASAHRPQRRYDL